MPLLAIDRSLIEIPVSDRITGGITVKQKALVVGFSHQHDPVTQLATTSVHLLVRCFAPDPDTGGYGPRLEGPQFNTAYTLTLTADNDTLVEAASGQIVARRDKSQRSLAPWYKLASEHAQPVMFQGDALLEARRHPVVINDVLTGHVLNADAAPSLFA